jgi:hypothetical protein
MPISTTHKLTLADAAQSFPQRSSAVAWRQANLAPNQGLAFSVPRDEWLQKLGVGAALLLLVLPDDLATVLQTWQPRRWMSTTVTAPTC